MSNPMDSLMRKVLDVAIVGFFGDGMRVCIRSEVLVALDGLGMLVGATKAPVGAALRIPPGVV